MTTEERLTIIRAVVAHYKAMDDAGDQLSKLLGAMPDCRALNPAWRAFDHHVKLASQLIGDTGDWLSWFIWDNGCGTKGFGASVPGLKIKSVTNAKQLARLIERG